MFPLNKVKKILLTILSFASTCFGTDDYIVYFKGVEDETLLRLLHSASQLIALEASPPTTNMGLKRRAENDIKNFIKVLHSQAYYNARIELEFDFDNSSPTVIVHIDPGVIYPIAEFKVLPEQGSEGSFPYSSIPLDAFGIEIGKPALTNQIFEAENILQQLMECNGYPYARIAHKEIIADQAQKNISATLFANSGSLYAFGNARISGNKRTRKNFFLKHIVWKEGELFSPTKLRQTQNKLELSGLFSSVTVSIPEKAPSEYDLPISIEVKENKPRTIDLGVNYETERGIGASAGWAHRNLTGMADNLGIKTSLWGDKQFGEISYIQPDFGKLRQNLIWSADYLRERDAGYTSKSYSLSSILARQVNDKLTYSYGLMYKHLIDTDVHENTIHQSQKNDDETFNLLKTPIFFYWNYTNNILNPTNGYRFKIKSIPSYKFIGSQIFYSINVLTSSYYFSIDPSNKHIFAFQATLGLIPGPCKTEIPRSELFDAGTDSLLRGYKYQTVSPLDNEYKPTGGRSMMIYSIEYRWRMSKDFGWVLFYDFGNVYASRTPRFDKKILQSTGVGLRYFTPVGPIRLDLAFPLNPRKHVDKSRYQVYLSVGQTF